MRVLIIILLLVLTPFRGWAADSMAVHMATQGMGEFVAAHGEADNAPALSMHCAEMSEHDAHASTGMTTASHDAGSANSSDPCNNCASCQVCATVALIAPTLASVTSPQVHRLPWAAVAAFTSAVLALGQKPPIS